MTATNYLERILSTHIRGGKSNIQKKRQLNLNNFRSKETNESVAVVPKKGSSDSDRRLLLQAVPVRSTTFGGPHFFLTRTFCEEFLLGPGGLKA